MCKTIGATIIGSHLWKMQRRGSDIDIFRIYMEPVPNVLDGTARYKSFQTGETVGGKYLETVNHEIKQVVQQLLSSNVNFVVGVLSPEILDTSDAFDELRTITRNYLSKDIYHSIYNMAYNLYYENVFGKKKPPEKMLNTILRMLRFGIKVLSLDKVEFNAVYGGVSAIKKSLKEITKAYEESSLPDKVPEKPFRNWLFDSRMNGW